MKITWKIWLLIAFLILAFLMIAPWGYFVKGVVIKSIEKNSSLFNEGLRQDMIVHSINSQEIKNSDDYTKAISEIFPSAEEKKLTISTDKADFIFLTNETPKITVSDIPSTRIKLGIDLQGGSRALVSPETPLTQDEMNDLIAVTSNRLNVFGVSDVTVKSASDLSGNNFMVIEVAGASPADLKELVEQQGKFEAKIGNETVFIGGEKDINYVARTGQEAGIYDCNEYSGSSVCQFRFSITISPEAAERFALITKDIPVNSSNPEYLSEKIEFYVDDNLVDSLYISKDLKANPSTQHLIQGSGSGKTKQDAFNSAQENMKKLQTILITGSLPYRLKIEKLDTISPVLGKEFTKNLFILALIVFAIVSLVLFIRYRKIKITLSVILTMFSEAFITLAVATWLFGWNPDPPGIAGIIAGIGTGVNDQIIIIDESVSETKESILERIKRALFIIIGAFLTIVAAMLPLFGAGAGLLRGFALTTIIGVSVGILITRPAFADILKMIQK